MQFFSVRNLKKVFCYSLLIFGSAEFSSPLTAGAVTIKPTVVKDTIRSLVVSWEYDFSNDPTFLPANSHELDIPSLTNWSVPVTSWATLPSGKWLVGLLARHIVNPDPTDFLPAGSFNKDLTFTKPVVGGLDAQVRSDVLIHPAVHSDSYVLVGDIFNQYKETPTSAPKSTFGITLSAIHQECLPPKSIGPLQEQCSIEQVPSPLPILGVGIALSSIRKARHLSAKLNKLRKLY
jgi:hypothetical protein